LKFENFNIFQEYWNQNTSFIVDYKTVNIDDFFVYIGAFV